MSDKLLDRLDGYSSWRIGVHGGVAYAGGTRPEPPGALDEFDFEVDPSPDEDRPPGRPGRPRKDGTPAKARGWAASTKRGRRCAICMGVMDDLNPPASPGSERCRRCARTGV